MNVSQKVVAGYSHMTDLSLVCNGYPLVAMNAKCSWVLSLQLPISVAGQLIQQENLHLLNAQRSWKWRMTSATDC